MRLIDADAFINDARDRYCKDCDKRKGIKSGKWRIIYEIGEAPCRACDVDNMIDDLENAPTVDAVERKRGEWIKQMDELAWWYECSVCGDYPLKDAYGHESLSRFCPNCGADMRGEEHEDIPMEYYENGGI